MTKEELKNLIEESAKLGTFKFLDCLGENNDLVNKFELNNFTERMIFLYRLDDEKMTKKWFWNEIDGKNEKKSGDAFEKLEIFLKNLAIVEERIEKIRKMVDDGKKNRRPDKGDDPITEEDRKKRYEDEKAGFAKELEAESDIHLLNLLAIITLEIDKINKFRMKAYCLELMEQKKLAACFEEVKEILKEGVTHIPKFRGLPTSFHEAGYNLITKEPNRGYNNLLRLREYYDAYSQILKNRKTEHGFGSLSYPPEIRIQADYSTYARNEKNEKIDIAAVFPDDVRVNELNCEIKKWARKKYKVFRRRNRIDRGKYEDEGNNLTRILQQELIKYGTLVIYYTMLPKEKKTNSNNGRVEYPSEILVMADCGSAYLWDERGRKIELGAFYPNCKEAGELDKEMEEWRDWYSDAVTKPNEIFPWEEFNKIGMELAKRVYRLVKDKNISVYYAKAYEEGGHNKEIRVFDDEPEDDTEEKPKEITIMADYDEYAWTNGVCCAISISDYFPDSFEIKEIEEELSDWLKIFLNSDIYDGKFDWDYFNARGRDLARRVHGVLKEYNIPVYYEKPYEDENGRGEERELIN
jgi:hypothetical protein